MTDSAAAHSHPWPDPLDAWSDTYATLHPYTQIVGKVRLTQAPWMRRRSDHSRCPPGSAA
jgi:hypothetical protein